MEKSSKITNFIKPDYDYLIKLLALGKWTVLLIDERYDSMKSFCIF